MACPACRRRSALIATLAPAISRRSLSHQSLLSLLALPNTRLLRAAKAEDPGGLWRGLELPLPSKRVPTALCRHDPGYPEALAQLPCAPAVLYATCTTERLRELLGKPTVAILGGRDYSSYARQRTFELARDLTAAGATVISGVNEGLEGIAHHGALHAHGNGSSSGGSDSGSSSSSSSSGSGSGVAVMGGAPDRSHRIRHDHLHHRILTHGAAISEFPPGFIPRQGWPFIASQRIIAALSSIVIVVEAAGRSCALLATQIAADLGHDIAVLPGRVTDPGGHLIFALLRDGAHPIAHAQDVLDLIHAAGDTRSRAMLAATELSSARVPAGPRQAPFGYQPRPFFSSLPSCSKPGSTR
jgi:DNA processing protein